MVNIFQSFLFLNHSADWYVASGSLLLHGDPGLPRPLQRQEHIYSLRLMNRCTFLLLLCSVICKFMQFTLILLNSKDQGH